MEKEEVLERNFKEGNVNISFQHGEEISQGDFLFYLSPEAKKKKLDIKISVSKS